MTDETCAVCGEPGTYLPGIWINVHGPADYTDNPEDGVVIYEWGNRGCYCHHHWLMLANAVVESMVLPERYEQINNEARIAKEVDLIKRYEEEHADD